MTMNLKNAYRLLDAMSAVINDNNDHTVDDVTNAWEVIDKLADYYEEYQDEVFAVEYYAHLFRKHYEPIIEAMERFEDDDHILELTAGCVWVRLRRIRDSLEWDLKEEKNVFEFKERLKKLS
jgi:hypothetical protein